MRRASAGRGRRGTSSPLALTPSLEVLDAFGSGGAPVGVSSDRQTRLELQEIVSRAGSRHSLRAGVRLRSVRGTRPRVAISTAPSPSPGRSVRCSTARTNPCWVRTASRCSRSSAASSAIGGRCCCRARDSRPRWCARSAAGASQLQIAGGDPLRQRQPVGPRGLRPGRLDAAAGPAARARPALRGPGQHPQQVRPLSPPDPRLVSGARRDNPGRRRSSGQAWASSTTGSARD